MEKSVVSIQNLSKHYGEFQAVDELTLEMYQGEIFALLGPNGAGKTTTIRMLMGILQPTAGSATIDGLDCFRQRAEVMQRVGYLPDEPIFYDYLRGREIIQFVGEMHGLSLETIKERSEPLLARLELKEALEEYANNYSKGMKKKLAAILALIHEPKLLILDEPTNGLDPYATRAFHDLIRDYTQKGNTIFFSTHLLDQAEKLCDRVGILFKGKLAAIGDLKELQASSSSGDHSLEEIFFAVTQGASEEEPSPTEASSSPTEASSSTDNAFEADSQKFTATKEKSE